MLTIPLEKLAYIIEKAREFDVEVPPVNEHSGTNLADEDVEDILEDTRSNPSYEELVGAIESLNDDELDELVALAWLGRGDYTKDEWKQALSAAHQRHNKREAGYLAGTPLLADYLEDAVDQLGYSLEDLEEGRM
ncbi:MAG: DUF3775 domain-containing protein [Rhodospirillaceae bacterium]|jgi:hypothetical protein|nr:DUF3775 domain-containing protein [Rhodospirillaceae bacterium]